MLLFLFSSRRRHTRLQGDWSSDVCSSDLSISVGHHDHHGPPPANQSSRVEPQLLGMLLFIISEVMVFGAFFTAYFFIRSEERRVGKECVPTGVLSYNKNNIEDTMHE